MAVLIFRQVRALWNARHGRQYEGPRGPVLLEFWQSRLGMDCSLQADIAATIVDHSFVGKRIWLFRIMIRAIRSVI